jgi:hypothetical protein
METDASGGAGNNGGGSGSDGANYGAGGGAGYDNVNSSIHGGNGAGGEVIITETYTPPALKVIKIADQVVTNSTTQQNDSALKVTLGANNSYVFDGELFVTSSSSPDIAIEFSVPAGATVTLGYQSGRLMHEHPVRLNVVYKTGT